MARSLDLFDDFSRPFGSLLSQTFPSRLMQDVEQWMPAVDIRQNDDAFVIDLEVPGFSPEQIEVEAHDNVLTIKGERSEESENKKGETLRKERRYGKFVRRFSLPQGAQSEAIAANVKDGLLTISIPHQKESTPQKIEVS